MIPWFVLREACKTFLLTLAASTAMLTLCGGVSEGLRKGFPPLVVAQLFPYVLPEILRFTIPGCCLFAVCSTFADLSSSNCMMAMKSVGVSPSRIIWPVAAAALSLSFITFSLYEVCARWARPGLTRRVAESLEEITYGLLSAEHSFQSEQFSIYVQDVQGRKLLRPVIMFHATSTTPQVTLTAEEAQIKAAQGVHPGVWNLRLTCRRGEIDADGQGRLEFHDAFTHDIAIDRTAPSEEWLSPAALPTYAIRRQLEFQESKLEKCLAEIERREQVARGLASQPEVLEHPPHRESEFDAAAPIASERKKANEVALEELRADHNRRTERWLRLQVEVPRRAANGLACFCFVLFGIPIAMRLRSADNMTVFFISFLPVLIGYYPLLVVGEMLARAGVLAPHSVWLGDVVFCLAGCWLIRRELKR